VSVAREYWTVRDANGHRFNYWPTRSGALEWLRGAREHRTVWAFPLRLVHVTVHKRDSLRYALWAPADQTIILATEDGATTVSHKEATLWKSAEAAIRARAKLDDSKHEDGRPRWQVEVVEDEAWWRAQEDTW